MRDCPACRTPLHGYEEVCPSCGAKQYPAKGRSGPYGTGFKPQEPKVNLVPFVVGFVVIIIAVVGAMQSTWIGSLMRGEKREVDPMEKMTYLEARNAIESQLTQGLTAAGAKGKLTWQASGGAGTGKPEERNLDAPVELTVATSLAQPEMRKSIVDPVKPYMEKAKLFTLTVTDARSHATWTYNMQPGTSPPDQAEQQ